MGFFKDRESNFPGRFLVTDAEGNSYYLTLTRADEPVNAGTPLNAATFNKLIDTMKLGTAATNLLDNADFRHPVNQRMVRTFSGGYGIDRWKAAPNMIVNIYADDDGEYLDLYCSAGASARNGISQYFDVYNMPPIGAPVTIAYQDVDGNIYVESTKMPESGSVRLFSGSGVGVVLYAETEDDGARLAFMVPPGETATLRWIAMYEGEFNVDTLPAFRRKGHAEELMECMRWAQILSTRDVNPIDLRPCMISAPVVTKIDSGYLYSAEP